MVHNHACPLSSHGCWWINWNWTQIKLNFSLSGKEQQQSKYLSMFPVDLFGVKPNPAKSDRNLGVIFDKYFTFRWHISAVCSSYFYHMCSVFTVTWIWILQNDLQMLWCVAILIIAIHFCQVLQTLTSPKFNVFIVNWSALWGSPFRLLGGTLLHSFHK